MVASLQMEQSKDWELGLEKAEVQAGILKNYKEQLPCT